MRGPFLSLLLLIAVTVISVPARSSVVIEPGADDWVITTDLPPFSLWGRAGSGSGGGGVLSRYFGDHPGNGGGGARYEDEGRNMVVKVRVVRDVRSTYIDNYIEGTCRAGSTGQMDSECSMVSVDGNAVQLYCAKPPQCTKREYSWRSGENLIVTVEVAAWSTLHPTPGAGPETRLPCPEPTEILAAYLQRYPSALTLFTDSPARGDAWRRQDLALELAAAEYKIAKQETVAQDETQIGKLASIEHHLLEFASGREGFLSGPRASREADRIEKLHSLPPAKRLQELRSLATEYHQWWTSHGYGPIDVPPLPPPTAVPTAVPTVPPVTPSVAPTP